MSAARVLLALAVVLAGAAPALGAGSLQVGPPAEVRALAVSINETGGLVGANASISVRVASNGSGHVFMDTRPLSGTDLQGSARIAARVAAGLTKRGMGAHDFFYTVRSDSPVISGPSAGAVLTLATTVALGNANLEPGEEPWRLREDVMATGTINPDGSVGPVGGILEKAEAARDAGASTFLVPEETYTPRLPPERQAHGEGPVNVSAFCGRELNITCRAVDAVSDLVELATGRQLPGAELGEPPSTARYADTLGPRTREVVDRAGRATETWERLNGSQIPDDAREAIEASLERAARAHREAEDLWEQDRFYSAASRAFQSSIEERHARLLLDYHDRGADRSFVDGTIRRAAGDVSDAEADARGARVEGLHELYAVGAAQSRVSEAGERIDRAREALDEGAANRALLQTAWALERARTVHWWLEMAEPFGPGPPLPDEVGELADEFVNLARERIAYSESVLGARGGAEQAREVLDQARRNQNRGLEAAALVDAAEAQVLASLALETRGGEPSPSKANASRRQSGIAIQEARGLGIEPILPIAMFEFAETRERPQLALRFFRTATVLAGLSSVFAIEDEPSPSRFVDPADAAGGGHSRPVGDIDGLQPGVAGWAAVGMFATLAAGTLGLALVRHKREES